MSNIHVGYEQFLAAFFVNDKTAKELIDDLKSDDPSKTLGNDIVAFATTVSYQRNELTLREKILCHIVINPSYPVETVFPNIEQCVCKFLNDSHVNREIIASILERWLKHYHIESSVLHKISPKNGWQKHYDPWTKKDEDYGGPMPTEGEVIGTLV